MGIWCRQPGPERLLLHRITFARFAGDDSQEAQQADLIHGHAGVGPRRVQTTPRAALLSGHPSHQHHVAPLVLTLQPAHPSWGDQHRRSDNRMEYQCVCWS